MVWISVLICILAARSPIKGETGSVESWLNVGFDDTLMPLLALLGFVIFVSPIVILPRDGTWEDRISELKLLQSLVTTDASVLYSASMEEEEDPPDPDQDGKDEIDNSMKRKASTETSKRKVSSADSAMRKLAGETSLKRKASDARRASVAVANVFTSAANAVASLATESQPKRRAGPSFHGLAVQRMKRVRQDKVRVRRAYLTAHDLYAVAVVRVRINNQKMHRNKDRFVNTLVFMLIFLPITWTIGRATYAAAATRAPFMKVAPAIALGIVRGVTVSSVYMLCHVVLAYWQGCGIGRAWGRERVDISG